MQTMCCLHGLQPISRDTDNNAEMYNSPFFTVVCLVTWPMNDTEAGVDLVLIET